MVHAASVHVNPTAHTAGNTVIKGTTVLAERVCHVPQCVGGMAASLLRAASAEPRLESKGSITLVVFREGISSAIIHIHFLLSCSHSSIVQITCLPTVARSCPCILALCIIARQRQCHVCSLKGCERHQRCYQAYQTSFSCKHSQCIDHRYVSSRQMSQSDGHLSKPMLQLLSCIRSIWASVER
jgi:hypothetical protein